MKISNKPIQNVSLVNSCMNVGKCVRKLLVLLGDDPTECIIGE